MHKLFVTFFVFFLLRPAPGTWGSVAGAICGYFIYELLSRETLFLASILLFLVSIKIIDAYEASTQTHDASHIVIDEVAGVWLSIAIGGGGILASVLALVFFRIFDITKPSFIGRIDKQVKGGLGVMGDDMLAGLIAGLVAGAIWVLSKPYLPEQIFGIALF